ncbi:hypothetical protein IWX63_000267 [Arthrobacter sp. CAN_A2]|uniref:LysM peptidoglycan-binding domain-containing protein n=1 Tax=Arthrobacter sp. CAN_A2 TaxID=2787718 RepID=UPI0018EFD7E7
MQRSDTIHAGMVLGCGAVISGAGAALLAGRQAPGAPALEGVLGVALAGIGLAVVGVWMLLFVVAVLAELLQRRGRSRVAAFASGCTPAMMRRLAAALLGVNLLAAPALAQAATVPSEGRSGQVPAAIAVERPSASGIGIGAAPGGSGAPDRVPRAAPAGGGQAHRHGAEPPASLGESESSDPAPRPVSPAWEPEPMQVDGGPLLRGETRTTVDAEEVVVAPGDSLWSIVAARLGPLATAADIAEAWPAWYDTNRSVIGSDPSLLFPGTVLHAPSG